MGGCVSSPKDLALNEGEDAPIESPQTPKNVEVEPVAQENSQEVSEEKEEALVDLSEPAVEEVATEITEEKAEDKNEEPLVTL